MESWYRKAADQGDDAGQNDLGWRKPPVAIPNFATPRPPSSGRSKLRFQELCAQDDDPGGNPLDQILGSSAVQKWTLAISVPYLPYLSHISERGALASSRNGTPRVT